MVTRTLVGSAIALVLLAGCKDGTIKKTGSHNEAVTGWVVSKSNTDAGHTLTIRAKGHHGGTIKVSMKTWTRCQLDRWYPTCK
jgi:hypothetical protein